MEQPGFISMLKEFLDEQRELVERSEKKLARSVLLDPEGTLVQWMAVLIRHPTGVIYSNQCGGTSTQPRYIEGYLVPVGPDSHVPTVNCNHLIESLRAPFHRAGGCIYPAVPGDKLPTEVVSMLSEAVRRIPFYHNELEHDSIRTLLEVDQAMLSQLVEAWIPVRTAAGPGVLVYTNCD